MGKFHSFVHPVKKEFRKEKCGFDNAPADAFVKSQWQSRSKSIPYLIYRWFIALFFTGVVIESMIDPDDDTSFWLYFIYLTNWGIMMCMLTNLLGAILVTTWHYHPEYEDKLMNMDSLTSPFRIYWGMHIITLVCSIVITIIYWSVLYDPAESDLSATNVLTHALNSILMVIDLLIVAHPLRLLHMFLPVAFGTIYTIFSVIYQNCGGLNKKGKPYIYHVLDWSQPDNAMITVVGVVLLTCCIYTLVFTIYKLRNLIHRRITNSSGTFLPTTMSTSSIVANGNKGNQTNGANTGIQHSPSGISMVLGDYSSGITNNAFSTSGENLSKH